MELRRLDACPRLRRHPEHDLYGNGDLEVTTDWRTILGELTSKRLLNDNLDAVFPDYAMPAFQGLFQVI